MVSNRLLEVAIQQFGLLGFEGASTREIARASGTAMSSITYHFGGKEGLYLAAADHIAAEVNRIQGPAFEMARAAVNGGREQAVETILRVLDSMALMMLSPQTENWSRFIIREQQAPTEAFNRLYRGVMEPVLHIFVQLVGAACPRLDEREGRAMVMLMFGQCLVLRAARATVCRVMEVETIDVTTSELLRARLRANALCILQEKHA